jgi:uncharacterized protein
VAGLTPKSRGGRHFERRPMIELASGDVLTIPVYTFEGTDPAAPSVYLQSAVHGPEVQGSMVLALLLDHLREHPPRGRVRIVPNANPVGLNNKQGEFTDGRFDSVTGDNFNRMYFLPTKAFPWDSFLHEHGGKSPKELARAFRGELKKALLIRRDRGGTIAERIAVNLQLLSIEFDHCLDLHCANRSERHIYAPEYTRDDVPYFQIRNVLLMPNDSFSGAMDEVFFHPWAELARKAGTPASVAVQSFTVELGDQEEIDRKMAEKDLEGILSYLAHRGVIDGKPRKTKPVYCTLENYTTVHSPRGGLVDWCRRPGDQVKKNDLLARILHFNEEPTFHEVRSPIDGIITLRHSSVIVHEGAELMKIIGAYE